MVVKNLNFTVVHKYDIQRNICHYRVHCEINRRENEKIQYRTLPLVSGINTYLDTRTPKAPKKRYKGDNWKITEQLLIDSSTPEGQSSIPSHHTVALIHASSSGH